MAQNPFDPDQRDETCRPTVHCESFSQVVILDNCGLATHPKRISMPWDHEQEADGVVAQDVFDRIHTVVTRTVR